MRSNVAAAPTWRTATNGPAVSTPQPDTSNKLVSGGLAGASVIIIAWAAKQFGGFDIPDYVQNAAGVIISLAAAHFTPTKQPPEPDL